MLEIHETNYDVFAVAGKQAIQPQVDFLEYLLFERVLSGRYRDLQEICEMLGLHGFSCAPLPYDETPWENVEQSVHKPSTDNFIVVLISAFNEPLAHIYVTYDARTDGKVLRELL